MTNSQIVQKHPYHLVDPSPWPFLAAFGALFMTMGGVMYMHNYTGGGLFLVTGFFLVLYNMYVWWRDIIREAAFEGQHTNMERKHKSKAGRRCAEICCSIQKSVEGRT